MYLLAFWYTGGDFTAPNCTITPSNPSFLPADGGVLHNGTSNVTINCNCTNTDYQQIRWYSPDEEEVPFQLTGPQGFMQDNGTLIIPMFNDSYQGTYSCGVGNKSLFVANISLTLRTCKYYLYKHSQAVKSVQPQNARVKKYMKSKGAAKK